MEDDLEMDEMEIILKVIVVGNGRVGKTSMITRFAKNSYSDEYKKTLGVDFLEKEMFVKSEGETVNFHIWDTAGQEEYDSLTKKYYRGARVCILAFSTTDRESFDKVASWRGKVEEECGDIPMVLVQTKSDLEAEATQTPEEVEKLAADQKLELFKTCAKED